MTERPKFFDDLAGVAGGALSAVSGLRDEVTSLARARVDETIRRLDLVRREEFDAVMELVSRAMADVETLADRVERLEAAVIPAKPRENESSSTSDETATAANGQKEATETVQRQDGNTST